MVEYAPSFWVIDIKILMWMQPQCGIRKNHIFFSLVACYILNKILIMNLFLICLWSTFKTRHICLRQSIHFNFYNIFSSEYIVFQVDWFKFWLLALYWFVQFQNKVSGQCRLHATHKLFALYIDLLHCDETKIIQWRK